MSSFCGIVAEMGYSFIVGVISSFISVYILLKYCGVSLEFDDKLDVNDKVVRIDVRNMSVFQEAYNLEATIVGKVKGDATAYDELSIRRNRFAFLSCKRKTDKKWRVIVKQDMDSLKEKYSHVEIFVRAKSSWFGIESLSHKTYTLD